MTVFIEYAHVFGSMRKFVNLGCPKGNGDEKFSFKGVANPERVKN